MSIRKNSQKPANSITYSPGFAKNRVIREDSQKIDIRFPQKKTKFSNRISHINIFFFAKMTFRKISAKIHYSQKVDFSAPGKYTTKIRPIFM